MLASIRQRVGLSPTKATVLQPEAHASSSGTSEAEVTNVALHDGSVLGYFVLQSSKGVEKGRFPLRKRITTIGRMQSCDIRIYQETVSRLHCQVCMDKDGKASLEVLNSRGVKINREKVQASKRGGGASKACYPLEESDVVEIFYHTFRLEYPHPDEDGKTRQMVKERIGRKSLRMSLLRAALDQGEHLAVTKDSRNVEWENAEDDGGEQQLEQVSPSPTKKLKSNIARFEEEKENVPMKVARRSFVLSTPSRQLPHTGPWETEPRKRKVKRVSLSPVKGRHAVQLCKQDEEQEASIVVMEEVDDEVEEEEVDEKEEEKEEDGDRWAKEEAPLEISEPAQTMPEEEIQRPKTPPNEPAPAERLSKSCPPKKTRRRSSFFGRAGIFAGINFGFYPEERKESAEQDEVESGTRQESPSTPATSPSKLDKPVTPQPRLDDYGMPRLPRSMSSPSGLNYGSPGKRRNISLRTATLLKTSQQVFEQQRLLSPPTSPTKASSSSFASLAPPSASPERKEEGNQLPVPLPSSSGDDEDDEDEVDKSLSSLNDEPEERSEQSLPPLPAFSRRVGARKSHGVMDSYSKADKAKAKGKGRASMPGTLISVKLVEGSNEEAVNEWQREWREKKEQQHQEDAEKGDADAHSDPLEAALHEAFDKAEDVDTDEEAHEDEQLEMAAEERNDRQDVTHAQEEQQEETSASHPEETDDRPAEEMPSTPNYPMLRHMIQASPHLIALLDEVTGITAVQKGGDGDVSNLELPVAAVDVEGKQGFSEVDTDVVAEELHPDEEVTKEQPAISIPKELLHHPVEKKSRRASEQPQRRSRRRSSAAVNSSKSKGRKSEGGVLICVPVAVAAARAATADQEDKGEVLERSLPAGDVAVPASTPRKLASRRQSRARPQETPRKEKEAPVVEPLEAKSEALEEERKPLAEMRLPPNDAPSQPTADFSEEEPKPRSPRKRSTVASKKETQIPVPARKSRAAKVAATAAIAGETVSLKERQASQSPVKAAAVRRPVASQQASSTAAPLSSDEAAEGSSCLVTEASSPVKRTRRAAKNAAAQKIKATLTRKPSVTVLRDARTRSEANDKACPAIGKSAASSRLLRTDPAPTIQSEPTRTTRSRAAKR